MKTKIVYVLTCAPEATYIEQALMAVWSARYHNQDAHIVLLTDNVTSALLHTDKVRGEVLQYISEEKVIPFEDDKNMHYRSRWLKSHMRELVKGDMLFIDCDTICTCSLAEIDDYDAIVAMVPDEHMHVKAYPEDYLQSLVETTRKLDYDVLKEEWYFNSGVIYAKDRPEVHELWKQWHQIWQKGEKLGIRADQPSLGKANIECKHIIQRLPAKWNTLIYVNPFFASEGKILHFWSYRNKSFMYARPFLDYLKTCGLTDYAKACVLDPMKSVLPFDTILSRCSILDYFRYAKQIREQRNLYAEHVDATFKEFPWPKEYSLVRKYISIHFFGKRKDVEVYFS